MKTEIQLLSWNIASITVWGRVFVGLGGISDLFYEEVLKIKSMTKTTGKIRYLVWGDSNINLLVRNSCANDICSYARP